MKRFAIAFACLCVLLIGAVAQDEPETETTTVEQGTGKLKGKIAYHGSDGDTHFIIVFDLATREEQRVIESKDVIIDPAISPSGEMIAYGGDGTSGNPPQVVIVDVPEIETGPEMTPTP